MASAKGYSAGRVFLQVVPSYSQFMNRVRKDAPLLAKAMEDQLKQRMDKSGSELGDSFGENFNKGLKERLDKDDFSRTIERKIAGVEKAFGQTHAPLRQMQKDFEDGKISSADLTNQMSKMGQEFRSASKDVDRHTTAQQHNNRTAADSILGTEKVVRATKSLAQAHRDVSTSTKNVDRDSNYLSRTLSKLGNLFRKNGNDSQQGANAFRFFSFGILAGVAAGSALIPILASLGGGIFLLGTLGVGAAAGLGVFALGISGILGAVKALHAEQDATSSSSGAYAKAVRNAARGVADAIDAQKRAERDLADAQKASKKAQEDLTKARKDARLELIALDDQVAQNALDERQAVIDLFNANNTYGATISDGGSTNLDKENADIALKQAQLNLKRIREEKATLAQQKSAADKGGVDSTDTVKNAQENLNQALRAEKDARDAVKKANQGVTRAQEDYNDALKGGAAAADNLALALGKLSPEGRRFAYYIASLRDNFEALRRIAEKGMLPGLEDALKRIGRVYGPGIVDFVDRMSKGLGDLFVKMSETFTSPLWKNFFGSLSKYSLSFTNSFADTIIGFLGGIAGIMTTAMPYADAFGKAIGKIADNFARWSTSDDGVKSTTSFFDYVQRIGPKVKDFFDALFDAISNLGVALAPVGESVLSFLTDLLNALANMDPNKLRAVAVGVAALVVALQSAAGLQAVASVIFAIATGPWLLLVAAVAGIGAAFFFLSRSGKDNKKTFDGLAKALKPLTTELKKAWKAFKPVAAILKEVAELVAKKLADVFVNDLLPALTEIVNHLEKKLFPAFVRFKPVLMPLVKIFLFVFGEVLGGAIRAAGTLITGIIDILSGLMDFITGVFTGNWTLAWQGIKEVFGGIVKAIWGLINLYFFGKILGGLKGLFTKTLPNLLKAAFKGLIYIFTHPFQIIGKAFSTFGKLALATMKTLGKALPAVLAGIAGLFGKYLGDPVMAVVDFVLNKGLIGGINTLLGFVGIDKKISKIPIHDFTPSKKNVSGTSHSAPSFHTGGIMPGYAPGIDRYNINVGGGEAILRPEVTRAIGGNSIYAMNRAAIRGGVGAVKSLFGGIQSFAKGGVFWPTKSRHWTTYAGHDGIDLNGPGNGLGDPYFAAKNGTIAYTGVGRGYGNAVFLKTDGGPTLTYGHSSKVNVHAGQRVSAGQAMGKIGYSGHVIPAGPAGSHLHFGLVGEPHDQGALALKFLGGAKLPKGGGSGLLGGLSKSALAAITNPAKYLRNRVSGGFSHVKGLGGTSLKLMKAIPEALMKGIVDKIIGFGGKALGVGRSFFTGIAGKVNPFGGKGSGGNILPKLYDQGGYLPPGLSTVLNKTGRPEPVFSPDQWDKMGRRGSGGDFIQNNNFTNKPMDANDLAATIAREGRRAKRGGGLARKAP